MTTSLSLDIALIHVVIRKKDPQDLLMGSLLVSLFNTTDSTSGYAVCPKESKVGIGTDICAPCLY